MKMIPLALLTAALAGCGDPNDRLSDEQAAAGRNSPIESPAAINEPAARAPAPQAGAGRVIFKAVGTEPGWALTVRHETMEYLGDYGSVRITAPTPANFRPAPGRYDAGQLTLTISPGPCSDGMSDLVYRQTVRLVADGKAVNGCGGGTIAPDKLADTSWTVAAINGRATPGGPGYFVSFSASEVSAKFGCNGMGGAFRLNGDHLSTSNLAQTLIGCPEPAATFERQGSAVLRSNMRIERLSGELIRLVSEAGSIDLRRAI
ncbi:MAG: META domain-containing protein [Sphingomicrobium sp.]